MNHKKILITGSTGFIGTHLIVLLRYLYPSCQITGIGRRVYAVPQDYDYCSLDMLNKDAVVDILDKKRPDYIIHLAGRVFSYDIHELYSHNVLATLNLFEAIISTGVQAQVVIAGSAAEYGKVPLDSFPISETCMTMPETPYGMTKLWQTQLAKYYANKNLTLMVGRIFNVIGRGAPVQLAMGDIFVQLEKIRLGKQAPKILVGNIKLKRDFIDIDDACIALISLLLKGKVGSIYNICSGSSVSLNEILNMAIELSALSDVEIIFDQKIMQNSYIADIYGCHAKIRQDTGWSPQISLKNSIKKALLGVTG